MIPDGSWRPPSGIVGEVKMFWLPEPPPGWLLCDGASYTQVEQPRLYAAMGSGGTVTVPDMRDRFAVAAGSTYSVGDTGGSTEHGHTLEGPPGLAVGVPVFGSSISTDGHLPPYYALIFAVYGGIQ